MPGTPKWFEPCRSCADVGKLVSTTETDCRTRMPAWHTGDVNRRWLAVLSTGALATAVWLMGSRHDGTLAETQGSIDARLVRDEGGRGPALMSGLGQGSGRVWLEIDGPHPRRIPIVSSELSSARVVELQSDPEGQRFAIRVRGEGWQLAFAGSEAAFVISNHPYVRQGVLDWANAPDFESAAFRIFERAAFAEQDALLREIRARHGERGVYDFLLEVMSTAPTGNLAQRRSDGAWGKAFRELSCSYRHDLREIMRQTFLDSGPQTPRMQLLRVLRYVDLEETVVLDAIERHLETPRAIEGRPLRAITVMLRALTKGRPETAGPIACRMLDHIHPNEILASGETASAYFREAVLAAIATDSQRCEPAEASARSLRPEVGIDVSVDPMAHLARVRSLSPRRDLVGKKARTVGRQRLQSLLSAAARPRNEP